MSKLYYNTNKTCFMLHDHAFVPCICHGTLVFFEVGYLDDNTILNFLHLNYYKYPLLKNNNCPMFVQSISCRLTQRKRLPKRYIFTKKKLSTHFQNFSLDNILKEFKLVTKNYIYIEGRKGKEKRNNKYGKT